MNYIEGILIKIKLRFTCKPEKQIVFMYMYNKNKYLNNIIFAFIICILKQSVSTINLCTLRAKLHICAQGLRPSPIAILYG